jgi:hypothetical protein
VSSTPGLYQDEIAVATRALKDAKRARKMSVRGRYFDHTIYPASTILEKGGEKAPVKATFMSMPVFALFQDSTADKAPKLYPSSKEIRTSDHHPIRSLLQYSNILAIDSSRDRLQVVTNGAAEQDAIPPFIHVPELWALVINMYTMITCAPFSVKDLCGDNVKLMPDNRQAHGVQDAARDTRTIVKYTDLKGTLRDFQCRTWFSLLDYVSRIEGHKEELKTLLNDPTSEYKIVDLNFRPLDKVRWNDIVDSQFTHPEFVHLRLLKLVEGDILGLKFAQKKLDDYRLKSLIYMTSMVVLGLLEQKLLQQRADRSDQKEIDRLKDRIKTIQMRVRDLRRSRYFNRFLLYAARFHLMYPQKRPKYHWRHPKSKWTKEDAVAGHVRKPNSVSS